MLLREDRVKTWELRCIGLYIKELYFIYTNNTCGENLAGCFLSSGYKYDAFISYKSTPEDESFVVNTLLPKLETEMNFKLCVHFRDFPPGAGWY